MMMMNCVFFLNTCFTDDLKWWMCGFDTVEDEQLIIMTDDGLNKICLEKVNKTRCWFLLS